MTHPTDPPTSGADFATIVAMAMEVNLRWSQLITERLGELDETDIDEVLALRKEVRQRSGEHEHPLSVIRQALVRQIAVKHGADPDLVLAEVTRRMQAKA